jgi:hypothetical protein
MNQRRPSACSCAFQFGEKRGISLSTLSWWRRVFRHAGDEEGNGAAAENPVVFTEVPPPANVPGTAAVVEIVLHSGHLVRVPAGADTAQRQPTTLPARQHPAHLACPH